MKPSTLRPGDTVKIEGIRHTLKFIRRDPRNGSSPPVNIFICDAYVGQNGPDDKGICTLSDSEVSRRCSKA
jgi:hypothetical protein